jgi:predicted HTH domain antitoxin
MTVEIPDAIGKLLPSDPSQRTRSVVEGLVLGAYTQGRISRGHALELLGLNYWDGEKFFSDRGIFLNYDLGEFQNDMKTS